MQGSRLILFGVVLALSVVGPICCSTAHAAAPGPQSRNPYGLHVVENWDQYQRLIQERPELKLVDLRRYIPHLVVDMRYKTPDNFMGRRLYPPSAKPYLTRIAAERLQGVQKELNRSGLGLKIFDAYRPYDVTKKMWFSRKVPPKYLAPPKLGSTHNRGIAVDCTLINLKSGRELPMPTKFDSFEKKAYPNYKNLPPAKRRNRDLLIRTMKKHGFSVMSREWWHFNLTPEKKYPVLNLSFDELAHPPSR